jgi:hypothetical protein
MSRADVRAAVTAYLTTPAVAGVDLVYEGLPFDQAGVDWDTVTAPGQTSRCFIVVWVETADDWNPAHIFVLDGAGGRRLVTYPVSLNVYFEDISGDPLAALHAQDAILDALAVRMRTDPSLGADPSLGIVVAAAPDLKINPGDIQRQGEGDTFAAWSTVDFPVSVYEYAT